MKHQIKCETSCGSITYIITADSRKDAEQIVALKLKMSGWEEVKGIKPSVHQFKIIKEEK